MDRIKTFEDALKKTGRPNAPEFRDTPEDLRTYLQSQYKAIVITEALNEGWKADYKDYTQKKWLPWFNTFCLRVLPLKMDVSCFHIRLQVAQLAFA